MTNFAQSNQALKYAEKRMQLYAEEVDSWKSDHEAAMACFSFQEILRNGIQLFDMFVRLDEMLTAALVKVRLKGEDVPDEVLKASHHLIQWWLNPCSQVEADLKMLEDLGFAVDGAEEFRKRHKEATWMLADASVCLNHEKMVDARDDAVDHLRAGNG